MITLLDDEVVLGAVVTVLAAYFVAYVDIVYAQLFVVLIIFFGMTLFGMPSGREYIRKNARVIGTALQKGIDQLEARTGYDIPDPVETALVNAVIAELEKRNDVILDKQNEGSK